MLEQLKKLFGRFFSSNPNYYGEFELVIVPEADLEENGFIRLKDFNTEYLKNNGITKDVYKYAKRHYSLFAIPYKGRHIINELEEIFNLNDVREIVDLHDQYLKYMEETIANDIASNPYSKLFEKYKCFFCKEEMELVIFDSSESEETHVRFKYLINYIKFKGGLTNNLIKDLRLEFMHKMNEACYYSRDLHDEDPLYSYWGYIAETNEKSDIDLIWNEEEQIFILLDEVFESEEEICKLNKLFKKYLEDIKVSMEGESQ